MEVVDVDKERRRLNAAWRALLVPMLVLGLAAERAAAQFAEPFLNPPPTQGDFISNFLKPEFWLPVGGGPATDVGGDLSAEYDRIFYKIDPFFTIPEDRPLELLIIGEFPRARYFSIAVYDDHGAIVDTLIDRDIVPLRPEFGNPYAVDGPAGIEDNLYAVTVRFSDAERDNPNPACDVPGLDLQANVLDARFRHTQYDRYSDDHSNFVTFFEGGPVVHENAVQNTGGMIGLRRYLALPEQPKGANNRYKLTKPLMWLRDVSTGCAYQLSQIPGQVVDDTLWYLGPDVLRRLNSLAHNQREVDLGKVTPPDAIPPSNGLKFFGGNEYRLHDNPDTDFVTGLVGFLNAPPLVALEGRVMRLDMRLPQMPCKLCDVPGVPCRWKVCKLTGSEELRYWGLSFIDKLDSTIRTVPDTELITDENGYVTMIVNFGAELPDHVNAVNGYTVVEFTDGSADDLQWVTLRNILPNAGFGCSTANVPFRTSEHHGSGGYMSEYLPFASYPIASTLPEVADPRVAEGESCEPPAERPPVDGFGIGGADPFEGGERTFRVWRTQDDQPQTVEWRTADDPQATHPAQADVDYASASGVLSFGVGEVEKLITVDVADDAEPEHPETFLVELVESATGNPQAGGAHVATIFDNDVPVYTLSAAGSVVEGDDLVVTVGRTIDIPQPQTVDYATTIGGLNTAEAADFVETTGTLQFSEGELEKTFSVPTVGDPDFEGNETFSVSISNVTGGPFDGGIDGAVANVTIEDDDCCGVRGRKALEDDVLELTIWRENDTTLQTIDYITTQAMGEDAAISGQDYTPVFGRVVLIPGQDDKTVSVPLLDDSEAEPNEIIRFHLVNTVSQTIIKEGSYDLEIVDDDVPQFTLAVQNAQEGSDLVATVTRDQDTGTDTQSVHYFARSGPGTSASAGVDFGLLVGTMTFQAGELERSFSIPTVDDDVYEGDETLSIVIAQARGGPDGGNVREPAQEGMISDNDCCGASAERTREGEAMLVHVRRALGTGVEAVKLATLDPVGGEPPPATAGVDYVSPTGELVVFDDGIVEQTMLVDTLLDGVPEGVERFEIELRDPDTGETLPGGIARASIVDVDVPAFSVSASSPGEGQFAIVTVSRDSDDTEPLTVRVVTTFADGDTADRNDIIEKDEELSFEPGVLQLGFGVWTTNDGLDEGDETFTVRIVSVSGGSFGGSVLDGSVQVTIFDDDQP